MAGTLPYPEGWTWVPDAGEGAGESDEAWEPAAPAGDLALRPTARDLQRWIDLCA
jgi:hypothetical protein